jgi:hypothetical protein
MRLVYVQKLKTHYRLDDLQLTVVVQKFQTAARHSVGHVTKKDAGIKWGLKRLGSLRGAL